METDIITYVFFYNEIHNLTDNNLFMSLYVNYIHILRYNASFFCTQKHKTSNGKYFIPQYIYYIKWSNPNQFISSKNKENTEIIIIFLVNIPPCPQPLPPQKE